MIFLTSKHLFWGTVNRSGAGTPHALSFVVNKPERRLLERQLKVVATPLALLSGAKEPWSTCSGGNKGGQRVHSGGRDSHNLSLRTHCDAQLSHAQAPGPRGSPHEPHAPIAGCGSPPPLLLTANVDSSFSSLALLHVGQVGLAEPMTRVSNRWPHFLHAYSKRGIGPPHEVRLDYSLLSISLPRSIYITSLPHCERLRLFRVRSSPRSLRRVRMSATPVRRSSVSFSCTGQSTAAYRRAAEPSHTLIL